MQPKIIRTCSRCRFILLKDATALKAEVDKLTINILVNVLTSQNNLITKADYLDVGELETAPIDFEKIK